MKYGIEKNYPFQGIVLFVSHSLKMCSKKMKGGICGNNDSKKHDIPCIFVSSIIGTVPQINLGDNNTTVWTWKRTMNLMLPEIAPQSAHTSQVNFSTCSHCYRLDFLYMSKRAMKFRKRHSASAADENMGLLSSGSFNILACHLYLAIPCCTILK